MADKDPAKMGRMFKTINRRPDKYKANAAYDKSIDEGIQDEDASKAHQDKVQEARKKRDWSGVKKLSQEWGSIRGYRK